MSPDRKRYSQIERRISESIWSFRTTIWPWQKLGRE
jgi:hypothetical protein